jgi:hypothetical protein
MLYCPVVSLLKMPDARCRQPIQTGWPSDFGRESLQAGLMVVREVDVDVAVNSSAQINWVRAAPRIV